VDHDQKLVQQLWPRDFSISDEQIEEDISVALNTPINASPNVDWRSFNFSRAKSGFFAFKYDKNEVVEGFPTRVWNLDAGRIDFSTRSEHLDTTPLPGYLLKKREAERKQKAREEKKKAAKNRPTPKFKVVNPETDSSEDNDESYTLAELEIQEKIKNYKPGYRQISDLKEDEWAEARKAQEEFTAYRPSLDPPCRKIPALDDFLKSEDDIHLGRPLKVETAPQTVSATFWMYEPQNHESDLDTIGLSPSRFVPLLDLLGVHNDHIRRFKSFMGSDLPPGVPIMVEIPMGILPLSARVKFGQVRRDSTVTKSWFAIPGKPQGYMVGEIIK